MVADVRAICDVMRAAGAVSVCDGVAFAPHRAIDVQALGCDFYFYSAYKVYGPHMGAMYRTARSLGAADGSESRLHSEVRLSRQMGVGQHFLRGCAGLLALRDYLGLLAGESYAGHATVQRAFAAMSALEHEPHERLYAYLSGRRDIHIVGPRKFGPQAVGTLSFRHATRRSAEIATEVNRHQLGIKHGNFYSIRLLRGLGIDSDDGVVRVSLVHYNTVGEIDRLIAVLDALH